MAMTRGEAPVSDDPGLVWQRWDPLSETLPEALASGDAFDAVCWAQGANLNDSLLAFDPARHLDLSRANVVTVLQSAAALVGGGLLRRGGARLVVVSSIWQERARADKLSYAVTKAAIGGLVRSAAIDLGRDGHLINGVLPGVLDTPMTRANLRAEQITAVAERTSAGRLADLDTLADTILFLCSAENNAITGQSITVDLGMCNAILL